MILKEIDATELDAIHNRTMTSLVAAGMKPGSFELDKAIADTLMPLLSSLEQDRSAKREAEQARAARRARLRVLK